MKRARKWRNWSGSVRCEFNHISHPHAIEGVQAEVSRCSEEGERLRVIGSGHSFSPLCASDENLMSLEHFAGIESVDMERGRVWVRAGTPLRQLGGLLAEIGLAQENLGDIDAASLGGAVATGMHGSGTGLRSVSTQVTAVRMVCEDGSVKEISAAQDAELFDAARLSLGALGVITHIELQCVDAYRLHYRTARAPLAETLERLHEYKSKHRNFEFCWFPYSDTVHLRFMDATPLPTRNNGPLRRAKELLLQNTSLWMLSETARRVPRASRTISRLSSRRLRPMDKVLESQDAYPKRRLGRFNRVEYSIPAERLPKVVEKIDRLIRTLRFRVHLPLGVRFAKADDLWLSPAYRRDSAYVSVSMYRGMPYDTYFAALSEIFDRYDGRPHWATLHNKTARDFAELYPRWQDFLNVRAQLDPRGVFLNPHLSAVFGIDQR